VERTRAVRAARDAAAATSALERLGEAEVRRRVADAAAPFRRPDGSYRFENRFRYLIAEV
jgi:hypothetical protein